MKTALITGATSGIGQEFAKAYAQMGYALILTGRRKERLIEFKKKLDVPTKIIVADLSKEQECKDFIAQLEDVNIDVFINNAGFGTCGDFVDTSLEQEVEMIHVNVIAMHILFKGVLKKMVKRNKGTILNVASSAGLLPAGPYMATYYASKSYVTSLTRAVARELKERNIDVYVCALCPGPVDTEFNDCAGVKFALKGITTETCVKSALSGMHQHKTIIVPELRMKAAMVTGKLLPSAFVVGMTGHQQKQKIGK